jgi:Spy/CpxP family protein refolding chaperone
MKKAFGFVLVLALVVLVGTAVYAASPDRGPANGAGRGMQGGCMHDRGIQGDHQHHRMGAYLDLSKEQQEKVRDVWNRYKTDTRNVRYDLEGRRVEMRKLFTDPKSDQASLLAKEKEIAGLRQKLMERRAQATLEWRGILTPDQIQKLDRMPRGRGMGRGFGVM